MTDIANLLPQKPPIVMVSGLINNDSDSTRSSFEIQDSNLFVENGVFTSSGLVENMAQTAALRLGLSGEKEGEKHKPQIGFIGALKNLEISERPTTNSQIQTEVRVVQEIMNFQVVEAKTFWNNREIASAELKIFLAEE